MKKKKLTTWMLTGVISVSIMSTSMMTGCGLLSSGAVRELAEEALSDEESSAADGAAQTASDNAGGSAVEELYAVAENGENASGAGEGHTSNFRKTDDFEREESADTSGAQVETDEDSIQFTTVDLNGTPVNGSVFQNADLTLVFVWATYCGPCIMSIPDYEELYENLPDNVNLMAIVSDVYEGDKQGVQEAKDIMDEAGAKFQSICLSDSVQPLLNNMQFTPSAFFVDREGHMVGDFMDGGGFSDAVERLSELMG